MWLLLVMLGITIISHFCLSHVGAKRANTGCDLVTGADALVHVDVANELGECLPDILGDPSREELSIEIHRGEETKWCSPWLGGKEVTIITWGPQRFQKEDCSLVLETNGMLCRGRTQQVPEGTSPDTLAKEGSRRRSLLLLVVVPSSQ
jgi:hypothetical protein